MLHLTRSRIVAFFIFVAILGFVGAMTFQRGLDVFAAKTKCVKEGAHGKDPLQCCKGLQRFAPTDKRFQFTCLVYDCGNGRCDSGEDYVSCFDCCVPNGGKGALDDVQMECCDGLIRHVVREQRNTFSCDTCGDHKCDKDESYDSCRLDCVDPPCVTEGNSPAGGEKCCDGLVRVGGGDMRAVCVRCGDGKCGAYEDMYNCAEDCPLPCVENGGTGKEPEQCCKGLVEHVELGYFSCDTCGNGKCDKPAEDTSSCPEDCRQKKKK